MKPSFLFPLLFLLFLGQAQAQIIYTDVVPDAVYNISGDTCHLDMDNDGIDDFLIKYFEPSGCWCTGPNPSWVRVDPLLTHAVNTTAGWASELDSGQVVGAGVSWTGSPWMMLAQRLGHCAGTAPAFCVPSTPQGEWYGGASDSTNKYLGLRFQIGTGTRYGWARLIIHGWPSSFTLKDYAYNSVPEELILAGDTGSISTGLAQVTHPSVRIIPNPSNGKFTIEGLDKSRPSHLEIRDAMGQEIHRSGINGPSFEIDLTSQPAGIYFLSIRTAEQLFSRALIKQ